MLGFAMTVYCQEYPTTLPEVLDGMGYRTSIVGKNHFGVSKADSKFISQGYQVSTYEQLCVQSLD